MWSEAARRFPCLQQESAQSLAVGKTWNFVECVNKRDLAHHLTEAERLASA